MLMVMGTHFSLTGTYSWTAFIAALVPTFLVSNLLLLNQFPDVDPDRSIGRRHFPIAIGCNHSSRLYGIFLILAYLSILVGRIAFIIAGVQCNGASHEYPGLACLSGGNTKR